MNFNFNDEEIHENLRYALIKLRELCESEDEQIRLDAAGELADLMLRIGDRQDNIDEEDEEDDGEEEQQEQEKKED